MKNFSKVWSDIPSLLASCIRGFAPTGGDCDREKQISAAVFPPSRTEVAPLGVEGELKLWR
jgi:hypothetical protein